MESVLCTAPAQIMIGLRRTGAQRAIGREALLAYIGGGIRVYGLSGAARISEG